ncbi:carboxymuconolactone decarboxylase family protein [Aliikangiella sp. G2MR2-5]|uniref:carboxymuconolactone decarboxylase family protein n=1 Tax=Aliikangiella sp. G2MR2-5 TaxID=2788943 RepID=UPI0018AA0565|nr:carboxymuconolactone decarboxylase family protein [Aliikangiella sp. G2MR2-5]
MTISINYWKIAPNAVLPILEIEKYTTRELENNQLNKALLELVKIRVSQLNACAYCIDMHTKDSRALGETEQRLYGLSAWRETPYYSEKERAALAWCEAITGINNQPVCDSLKEEMKHHFDERSIVDLTMAICAINSWNRLAGSLGADVGSYQVGQYR